MTDALTLMRPAQASAISPRRRAPIGWRRDADGVGVHPGVYVEEVPSSPRPIEGVGTSTAARVSDDPEKP
jgi:hypothetical protein